VGFLSKLKQQRNATFFDFSHSKILELKYKHSHERLAIPDWVDEKEIYWLIKECLTELRGISTTIPNAYAWVSLRLKTAFQILWGLKTQANCFQDYDGCQATIILDWSDFTVEDIKNASKITFRQTEL